MSTRRVIDRIGRSCVICGLVARVWILAVIARTGSRRFGIVLSAERLRCFARSGFVVVSGVIDEAVLAVFEAEVEVDGLMTEPSVDRRWM